jgi:DegV family protein with EDD domain
VTKIGIITDSTAQFPNPSFAGKDLVRIIPFDIKIDGKIYKEGKGIKASDFPLTTKNASKPTLVVPSAVEIANLFTTLLNSFSELLVVVTSTNLLPIYENAINAVELIQGGTAIQVINSQTISSGLGLLVQTGAEAISNGASLTDAERQVRQLVPHVYTLICAPGLKYLYANGMIEYTQAIVGEHLNLHPIFTLEEGYPKALCKVRNFRHAQDFFQEFIEEFDQLQHIALLKGANPQPIDNRLLRQFVQEYFPDSPFSEHRLNPFVASIFGPRTLALIVVEKPYNFAA